MTPFDPDAQFDLALRSLLGIGAPMDKALALDRFLAAAEQGHDVARIGAARMLFQGDGVPADLDRASSLLETASHQNARRARVLTASYNAAVKSLRKETGLEPEEEDGPVLDLNEDPADWETEPPILVSRSEVALAKALSCRKEGDRPGALEWARKAAGWGSEEAGALVRELESVQC